MPAPVNRLTESSINRTTRARAPMSLCWSPCCWRRATSITWGIRHRWSWTRSTGAFWFPITSRDGRFASDATVHLFGPTDAPGPVLANSRASARPSCSTTPWSSVPTWAAANSRFVSGTGEHAGLTPYPGSAGLTTAVVDGVALIPSVDLDSMKAMVVWDPAGGSLRHVIDLPEAYQRSLRGPSAFMGMFGLGTVAAWPDTMLFGMGGTNEVYVATWDGEVIDTVHLPNVRRRGVPHDAQERIDDIADASMTFNRRMEMLSFLHGLYVMSDGATVFIHHDIEVVGEPPMVELLATIHASVLSRDRRTACVDGPIEFANEMRVVHTVARDTLYLLDRTLNEAEDTMMTWIRRYGIDTSACDWLPVG